MLELSGIVFFLFILMAAFDSFYWHIFKLKLYLYKDTRKEHMFHTGRNLFLLFVLYFLFLENTGGLYVWLGIVAIVLDMLVLLFDLTIENEGRTRFGGISKWEYVLHVMANGVYFASLTLLLAAKTPEQWQFDYALEASAYPAFLTNAALFAFYGSILSLIIHIGLIFVKPQEDV